MDNRYRIDEDCKLVRAMRGHAQNDLAEQLGLGIATLNRWENRQTVPSAENLEKFYSHVYETGIRLNQIKEQFYKEETGKEEVLLFHGAKAGLNGRISPDVSRTNNDFGRGFYMGETFRQAALFVSNFESSCVYCVRLKNAGLTAVRYSVDTDWMMTIACFRGRLNGRVSEQKQKEICAKALTADYIIAPIADNRMYQIIDNFIDGEITDEQCRHALAATELGMQYVIKSEKAAKQATVPERCFLCSPEKRSFISDRSNDLKLAEDKVRAARIKYRGKGKYIDELL